MFGICGKMYEAEQDIEDHMVEVHKETTLHTLENVICQPKKLKEKYEHKLYVYQGIQKLRGGFQCP